MDRFLNAEEITIRQPLYWTGTGIFLLTMVGGVFADVQYGHFYAVLFDFLSLATVLVMALLVKADRVGMRAGLGSLLYIGAANFVLTLVLKLQDPASITDAFLYKELFVYSIFMGLGVVLVGRSAALVFGSLVLSVLVLSRVLKASPEFHADFWFEVPLVAGAMFILYRYRSALDTVVANQRRIIRENRALRERERLAALGELTAGISHEIKNPLNLVVNFAESSELLLTDLEALLAKDDPGAADKPERDFLLRELRQNMSDLRVQGLRGVSIVQSMLHHARTDTGDFQSLDLRAVVKESLTLAGLGEANHRDTASVGRSLSAPSNPVLVMGSAGELARVFLNLCSNAFWSVTEQKRRSPAGPEPLVLVTITTDGAEVRVDVLDNGLGIDPTVKGQLFVPFFTTKPAGQGTGLGLSLALEVIRRHGGRIEVQGEAGQGAKFSVVLPLAP